jgi:hypothetical protein
MSRRKSMLESDKVHPVPARKRFHDAWDIMRLRLPPGTFARIQKVLKSGETKTEVIRTALEQELQRREVEKKRK